MLDRTRSPVLDLVFLVFMAFFLMNDVPFPSPFDGSERHRGFLWDVGFSRGPQRTPRNFMAAYRRAMGTDDMKRVAKKGRE